jgi:hypothetical protein
LHAVFFFCVQVDWEQVTPGDDLPGFANSLPAASGQIDLLSGAVAVAAPAPAANLLPFDMPPPPSRSAASSEALSRHALLPTPAERPRHAAPAQPQPLYPQVHVGHALAIDYEMGREAVVRPSAPPLEAHLAELQVGRLQGRPWTGSERGEELGWGSCLAIRE